MTKHSLTGKGLPGRIRNWSGWSRDFVVDCIAALLLAALYSLLDDPIMGGYESTLPIPASWHTPWMLLWTLALTLPYALHRTRTAAAIRWFLVTATLQMLIGPDMLLADVMAAAMLYSGLVYDTRARTRRYLVTAAVFDVLVSFVFGLRSVIAAYRDAVGAGFPTMRGLLWGDTIEMSPVVEDGATVMTDYVQYSGLLNVVPFYLTMISIVLLLAVVIGFWQRARRQTIRLLSERNASIRAREQEERLIAASAERARIARDMHDVVAHTLSIIIIQSDGGRYAATNDPRLAVDTMRTIRDESERALDDMTHLLGVFSDAPTSDYHDIDALINQARTVSADMRLTRTVSGRPQPAALTPAASEALYHVVQEALTNVRKYAGRNVHVTVDERWEDGTLSMTIDDDGRGAAASLDGHTPGYGLMGMRERIDAVGGAVTSGPRVGGGFEVSARVPLRGADAPRQAIAGTAVETADAQARPSQGEPDATNRDGRPPALPRVAELGRRLRGRTIDHVHQDEHANWIVRLSHWFEHHYVLTDACVAALLIIVLCVTGSDMTSSIAPNAMTSRALEMLMTILLVAPLALRRRFPQTVTVVFAVICLLQLMLLPSVYGANLLAPFVVYTAAVYGGRGNWKWLVPLVAVDSLAFACKVVAENLQYPTVVMMFADRDGIPAAVRHLGANPMLLFEGAAAVSFICCLIAMMFGLWVRVNGSNPQVLQARADALKAEQEKARINAANHERDRISASIQTEVSDTLHTVIDQTTRELDEIDARLAAGETPSPQSISDAFAAIGAQGRAALARMRQLLSVLRETGFSDDHDDADAHMTMPLAPVGAMARERGAHDA